MCIYCIHTFSKCLPRFVDLGWYVRSPLTHVVYVLSSSCSFHCRNSVKELNRSSRLPVCNGKHENANPWHNHVHTVSQSCITWSNYSTHACTHISHTHACTQNNYCNPHACVLRVNNNRYYLVMNIDSVLLNTFTLCYLTAYEY